MPRSDLAGLGRSYVAAIRARDSTDPSWAVVTWGDGLTDDEHLALVLEAVDAAVTDDELWMIGDGPVEEGLAPRRTAGERLRAARPGNEKLERLWDVMRGRHTAEDGELGYWTL